MTSTTTCTDRPETAPPTQPVRPAGSRWLAGTGVVLLTFAAVDLVSARWSALGQGPRAIVLLAASALVAAIATAARKVVPETAKALDVLLAVLVPADAAAIAIVTGSGWPSALLSAGPMALISATVLRRHQPSWVDQLIGTAGGVMTSCGLAAEVGVPAPAALAALAFVTAVVVTPSRSEATTNVATAWAALAGLSPALRLLEGAVFTGMGTMRDMGLLDAAGVAESVGVTLTAGASLVIVALQTRREVVGLLATAVATAGGLDVYALVRPSTSATLTAAAILFVAVELGLGSRAFRSSIDTVFSWLTEQPSLFVSSVNAAALSTMAVVATHIAFVDLIGVRAGARAVEWAAPSTIVALGWVVAGVRRRGDAAFWGPAVPAVVVTTGVSAWHLSGNASATALVLVCLGNGLVASRLPLAATTAAAVLVGSALPLAFSTPLFAVVLGAAAALGLVFLATTVRPDRTDPVAGSAAPAALSLVPMLTGTAVGYPAMPLLAIGCVASVAVAAAVLRLVGGETRFEVVSGFFGYVAWLMLLDFGGVTLVDAYVLPALVAAFAFFIRINAPDGFAVGWTLLVAASIAVGGRASNGSPTHLVLLSAAALVLAVWGGWQRRPVAFVAGGTVAVAAASYESLAFSVGHVVWVWLVVGGAAALTAAGLIELADRRDETTPEPAERDLPWSR